MTSEESKIEYVIKVAEKAENFGVTYFQVKLGKDIETAILHWIGITATGINLYALEDKLEPRFTWPWVEVDDLNYKYVQAGWYFVTLKGKRWKVEHLGTIDSRLKMWPWTYVLESPIGKYPLKVTLDHTLILI